jgi:prolyl-tRNA synthetase
VFHDEKGLQWPSEIAPYDVHLISLPGGEEQALKVYEELQKNGIDVLWDDRDESAGVKFADADLIGIPVRLVVSKKTGDKAELKFRSRKDFSIMDMSEIIRLLTK